MSDRDSDTSLHYTLPEVPGKPTLTFKDLFILVIIGIFIFASAGISDLFEMSLGWSPRYETVEVAELVILSLILAVAFGIFPLRRWREVRHEMAVRKRAMAKVKNTDRRITEEMKERERYPLIASHDLGAPVWNISDELEGKGFGLSALRAIVEAFGGVVLAGPPTKAPRKGKEAKNSTFYSKSAKTALKGKDE